METMTASEARNNISKLWEAAAREPVTVEAAGKPVAVVLSPEAYNKLANTRQPRVPGCGRHLLKGVDIDALLSTPIDDVFEGYL